MYFLRYSAFPTEAHPEYAVLGEAFICCWIEQPTLAAADKQARENITTQHWRITERDAAAKVKDSDYAEDDDFRQYYEQALTDKDVCIYYLSPRFPVYWVVANVHQGEEVAEAHYFVTGESLVDEDENVAVPNFWVGRRDMVLTAARDAITEAGWKILAIASDKPCGREDLPEEMHFYYAETEENGATLVFMHDGEDGQAEAPGQS
jgi:hypothetical protein